MTARGSGVLKIHEGNTQKTAIAFVDDVLAKFPFTGNARKFLEMLAAVGSCGYVRLFARSSSRRVGLLVCRVRRERFARLFAVAL